MRLSVLAGLVAGLATTAQAAPATRVEPGTGSEIQQVAAVSRDTVRFVQQELAARGYYTGAIDGIVGPRTRAAVRAYEADSGLPVTGNAYALADQLNYGDGLNRTVTQRERRVVVVERPVVVPQVVPQVPYYRPYYSRPYYSRPYYSRPTSRLYVGPQIGFGFHFGRSWGGRHWRR